MLQMLLWASLLRVPEDDDMLGSAAAQSRPTWLAASSAETPTFDVNQVTFHLPCIRLSQEVISADACKL